MTVPVELAKQWDAAFKELTKKRGDANHRLLGYAGFLTCNGEYQQEKGALYLRWSAFATLLPLPFHANAHGRVAIPVNRGPVDVRTLPLEDAKRFLDDMSAFLRKWQLRQLVTWELPFPQGPLTSVPLSAASGVLGPSQTVTALPAFFDIPSTEDVREETRQQQQLAAHLARLDGMFPLTDVGARADRASSYEAAFRLWLTEETVRTRYGTRHGLTARLVDTFAKTLDLTLERIWQVRKKYKPFLKAI
jgi:hypothetical protein